MTTTKVPNAETLAAMEECMSEMEDHKRYTDTDEMLQDILNTTPMKHILLTILLVLCSIAASAQVPKFFGVPVDGSPDNFVAKLKRAGKVLELEGDNGNSRTYSFADNENASLVIEYQKNLIYCITMTMYEDSEEHQDITTSILLARSKKDNGSEGYKRHTYIGSDKVSIRKETPQGDIYITPESPDASNYWTYAVVYEIWNVTNSKKLSE